MCYWRCDLLWLVAFRAATVVIGVDCWLWVVRVLICSGEKEKEDKVVTTVHRHRHSRYGQPGVSGLDFASGEEGSPVLPPGSEGSPI